MKKIVFILFLFMVSCAVIKPTTIYQKSYAQNEKNIVMLDIRDFSIDYNLDTIPLEDWMIYQEFTQCGYKIERAVVFRTAPRMRNYFVYTTFIEPDTIFYTFEILEKGKR